ncbi:hypothetical protein MMC22_001521 [Lobaria immixta]|nr:hypothetical protein [Lobaria immixta]
MDLEEDAQLLLGLSSSQSQFTETDSESLKPLPRDNFPEHAAVDYENAMSGVQLPLSNEPENTEKIHPPAKSHRCPRCFSSFTRRHSVKQHFPACITRVGNPQNLKWDDTPLAASYNPVYSLYDPRSETGWMRHKDRVFILKKFKHGNLAQVETGICVTRSHETTPLVPRASSCPPALPKPPTTILSDEWTVLELPTGFPNSRAKKSDKRKREGDESDDDNALETSTTNTRRRKRVSGLESSTASRAEDSSLTAGEQTDVELVELLKSNGLLEEPDKEEL